MQVTLNQAQFQQLQSYLAANPEIHQPEINQAANGRFVIHGISLNQLNDLFTKAGVGTPELQPPDTQSENINPSQLSARVGTLQQQLSADIYMIMGLLHKMSVENRESAREARELSYEMRWNALQDAADEMRSAAGKRFTAAMFQGGFQIASGTLSLVGGVKSGGAETKQAADSISMKYQGYSQMTGGVGQMVTGSFNYSADLDGVDQKEAETRVEKEKEFISRMNEMMTDVRQKLAAMEQSNHETTRKIWS